MTVTQAIALVWLRATGKTTTLTSGAKFNQIIALLDYFQSEWAREPGVDWNSLYDPASLVGTVTATDAFDLDSSIRKLSDREGDTVRIVWSDGVGYTDYDIVDANKLKDYSYGVNKESPLGFYCAQIGSQLVFNHKFTTSDKQYGGKIYVPAYAFPDTIDSTTLTEDIQVDNPNWVCVRAAAEFARNDITRRQRWPELLSEANELMSRMKDDNDGQIDTVDRPWTPFTGGSDAWSS